MTSQTAALKKVPKQTKKTLGIHEKKKQNWTWNIFLGMVTIVSVYIDDVAIIRDIPPKTLSYIYYAVFAIFIGEDIRSLFELKSKWSSITTKEKFKGSLAWLFFVLITGMVLLDIYELHTGQEILTGSQGFIALLAKILRIAARVLRVGRIVQLRNVLINLVVRKKGFRMPTDISECEELQSQIDEVSESSKDSLPMRLLLVWMVVFGIMVFIFGEDHAATKLEIAWHNIYLKTAFITAWSVSILIISAWNDSLVSRITEHGLMKVVKMLKATQSELEAEKARGLEIQEDHKGKIAKLQAEIAQIQTEHTSLKEEKSKSDENVEQLAKALKLQMEVKKEELAQQEEILAEHMRHTEHLKAELESAKHANHNMEEEAKRYRDDYHAANVKVKSLEERNQSLQEHMKNVYQLANPDVISSYRICLGFIKSTPEIKSHLDSLVKYVFPAFAKHACHEEVLSKLNEAPNIQDNIVTSFKLTNSNLDYLNENILNVSRNDTLSGADQVHITMGQSLLKSLFIFTKALTNAKGGRGKSPQTALEDIKSDLLKTWIGESLRMGRYLTQGNLIPLT